MKRVLFHIGPHETGANDIQEMLRLNVEHLPKTHQVLPKTDPRPNVLRLTTLSLHEFKDIAEHTALISETCTELARNLTAENTLFSDEDLLGPMPTLENISGLYPFVEYTIPAIQAAFQNQDVDVQFFFYLRDYNDWLRSIHRRKFRNRERPFAPRKFKNRNELPDSWTDIIARLRGGLGPKGFVYQSYESDKATGRFGTALFRQFGLEDETLDKFAWIDPA